MRESGERVMEIRAGVTSLGCAKNLVDSEVILGFLSRAGITVCDELEEARVIIVNTCAFIQEAVDEAYETVLQLLALKEKGEIDHVIVTGCLLPREGDDIHRLFPGIDALLPSHRIPEIPRIVREVVNGVYAPERDDDHGQWFLYDHRMPRNRLSPPQYAYVKIGEGCSNRCSYCLIPHLKGALRSRPVESIVREVEQLRDEGIREVNLISQDTTAYGIDRYGKPRIKELLERLTQIDGLTWIRLLYGHPARYDEDLLRIIAGNTVLCAYIDFPVQHSNDRILAEMNRGITRAEIAHKLASIRAIIPDVALRTTVMVGFPGETERDFRELLEFIQDERFEHLGAFTYSREEGTRAAKMPDQVAEEVKNERFHRLLSAQREIVREQNRALRGRILEVMIEEPLHEGPYCCRGRTERDAPEVDGAVYCNAPGAKPGDFVQVRITGEKGYDLVGEIV